MKYLLDVDTVACTTEDETCSHCFGESPGLFLRDLVSTSTQN